MLAKCFPRDNFFLGQFNWFKSHTQYFYTTDRSKATLLLWFSMLLVLVSVSVLFSTPVCLNYLNMVYVAEWLPFGKELLNWLTVCSRCTMSI